MQECNKGVVTFLSGSREQAAEFTPGERVLDVMKRAGLSFDAPCGGLHTCGKCRVRTDGVCCAAATAEELRFLTGREVQEGVRLACFATLVADGWIQLPGADAAHIKTEGVLRDVAGAPLMERRYLQLPKPSVADQRSDEARACAELGEGWRMSGDALLSLPSVAAQSEYCVTAVCCGEEVVKVLPGDCTGRQYAFAVDIGTTTVVVYLVNVLAGEIVGTKSEISAQKPYGADVISRIHHTQEQPAGLAALSDALRRQLDDMFAALLQDAGVSPCDVDYAVLDGNTVMMHLLLGVPPQSIARAPFQPVFDAAQCRCMADLEIEAFSGLAFTLPCVSGYIGSDITAGVSACGMHQKEGLCLLIDIGTNGEMVLGNASFLTGCSTAAGPAFEGAQIQFGMGGVLGAVCSFTMRDGVVEYGTIGNAPAIGICGSGLIDIMAALLENGIVDETGRMKEADEIAEPYRERACEFGGESAFCVARSAEGEPIVVTQQDIRQLQLAKAAIAAGIRTLLHETEHKMEEICHVYLAGGFGSFVNTHSAVVIGLLPQPLESRVTAAGNLAGMGAVLASRSAGVFAEMGKIAQEVRYVELSASEAFQDYYMDCMLFEELR